MNTTTGSSAPYYKMDQWHTVLIGGDGVGRTALATQPAKTRAMLLIWQTLIFGTPAQLMSSQDYDTTVGYYYRKQLVVDNDRRIWRYDISLGPRLERCRDI
ncbi:hypothetical protein B0H17DRAFT_1235982 [Mycena rosella]|uniref:Uncharacterized protein n=1 Tax=Mycena rosella TaxID=1033263 RepID=A0AAD7D7T1_MYCRO|nr:hypothetical protein B0H17DRAFT_1235982 [Mycena rosella]